MRPILVDSSACDCWVVSAGPKAAANRFAVLGDTDDDLEDDLQQEGDDEAEEAGAGTAHKAAAGRAAEHIQFAADTSFLIGCGIRCIAECAVGNLPTRMCMCHVVA